MHGISDLTFYNWHSKFCGMEVSVAKRLKQLEDENRKLKQMLADSMLESYNSLTGQHVDRFLERMALTRGLPGVITVDNGSESISKVLALWAFENNVRLRFTQPGKPVQNAYIESFNGKFWDECLNDNVSVSLNSARQIIESWRLNHNSCLCE